MPPLSITEGIGIWQWAVTPNAEPDVVMACCGDALEVLAAVSILRQHLPDPSGDQCG